MATNVPVPTLGLTGFLTQPDSAILAGVIADIQAAFGGTLNLSTTNPSSLTTPQGQLASSITGMISDCYSQFLQLASQTDPQYAQGAMQDAIGNIYFMQRIPASGTTVSATVLGLQNTAIAPNTAVAQDAAGNLYSCATPTGAQVVIPSTGSILATFTNVVTGATQFAAPMTVYQSTPGWSNITSPVLLQLGAAVESQQAFEARRQASVAANSVGQFGSIKGAILAALASAGVGTSVYVTENGNAVNTTIGGVLLLPNSVYIACAAGSATNAAVAAAIWKSKGNGCSYSPSAIFNATVAGTVLTVNSTTSGPIVIGQTLVTGGGGAPYFTSAGALITLASLGTYNGVSGTINLSSTPSAGISGISVGSATVQAVQDTSYAPPYPTYYPQWTVPAQVPIYVQVTLVAASLAMSAAAAAALLATPITNAFTGADGGIPASQIGATVFGSRFFGSISSVITNPQIVSVLVNTSAVFTNNPVSVPININQIPVYGAVSVVLV
jgi:hypothetical protein